MKHTGKERDRRDMEKEREKTQAFKKQEPEESSSFTYLY